MIQLLSRLPALVQSASKLIPAAFSRGRMIQQAMPHVVGAATGMAASSIADEITRSEPTAEKLQEIQGQVEAYAAQIAARDGIGLEEAQAQAQEEIGNTLRESAQGDPSMLANVAAFMIGMIPGYAIGGKLGSAAGKRAAGTAPGAEAFLAKAGSREARGAAVKTRLTDRTGAAAKIPKFDAGDAQRAKAPIEYADWETGGGMPARGEADTDDLLASLSSTPRAPRARSPTPRASAPTAPAPVASASSAAPPMSGPEQSGPSELDDLLKSLSLTGDESAALAANAAKLRAPVGITPAAANPAAAARAKARAQARMKAGLPPNGTDWDGLAAFSTGVGA